MDRCFCGKAPADFFCMCYLCPEDQLLYEEEESRRLLKNEIFFALEKIEQSECYKKVQSAQIEVILKMKKTHKQIFWLTINPREDIDILDFQDKIKEYMKRSFVIKGSFVIEQTGKTLDEMGKHPHVHILFEKLSTVSPKQLQDRTYNTFKNMCGNIKCINVKVYTDDLMEDKISYMRGDKWDSKKDPACLINIPWRKKFNLT